MLSTQPKPCFALVDCNNFYASCERVFNPKLANAPVLILSSNDGCVIARSNESKQLGIEMGMPFFKIQSLCRQQRVNVFSSNFALYGDMSRRVMQTLNALCPDMEIYSIDEAFLRIDKILQDKLSYAQHIRDTVLKNTGIPVSVGLAPSKTLAKIASHMAKLENKNGVYDLTDPAKISEVLKYYPVQSLWGVGKKSCVKLHDLNIYTAAQLLEKPVAFLKKHFSILMTRLVNELRGISCLYLEEMHNKKNIVCSRSFGKPVTSYEELSEAISSFAAQACFKARKQKTKAQGVSVFFRTSLFLNNKAQYSAIDTQTFVVASNDTMLVLKVALNLLKKNFKKGPLYKKAGVVLFNLTPDNYVQHNLFQETEDLDNIALMNMLDAINAKQGRNALFLAAEGVNPKWQTNSARRSQRYTTVWSELPVVYVGTASLKSEK